MEFLIFLILGIGISYLYLKHAPMHDLQTAIFYAEHVANQKHKDGRN